MEFVCVPLAFSASISFCSEISCPCTLGVQRLPVFHSTKNFVFRKGAIIGLLALLTPLDSLAFIYWGQKKVRAEDSPQLAHGGDILVNRVRLLGSQHWC